MPPLRAVRAAAVRAAAGLSILAGLAACQGTKPAPVVAEIGFAGLKELRLDVAELQVVPAYVPPRVRPNVDHLFPTAPQDAAIRWVREKVRAAGASRRALVVIRRASVTETALPLKRGLSGAFSKEPSERYEAVLEVDVEIRSDHGGRVAMATARATRSKSVMEGTTEPERRAAWQALTQALIEDLAREFERQVRAHLGQYVR